MKKLLFSLVLTLVTCLSALAITPKQLAGRWVTDEITLSKDATSEIKACYVYRFTDSGKMTVTISLSFNLSDGSDAIKGNMYISASGTYTTDGSQIDVAINPYSVQYDVPNNEIVVKGSNYTKNDAQTILEGGAREAAQELKDSPSLTITNVSVKGAKLYAKMGSNDLTFTRIKEKKSK